MAPEHVVLIDFSGELRHFGVLADRVLASAY
jgi:hypothetical protein